MTGPTINLPSRCPRCFASLMSSAVEVDHLPAIELRATVWGLTGTIYLSQVYGSYEKRFVGVPDAPGTITEFSCPRCGERLPVRRTCRCGADMAGLYLVCGGVIHFCTRNGCREHLLHLEHPCDAYRLYEQQMPWPGGTGTIPR